MLNNLIAALRFITILPLGRSEKYIPLEMRAYFPAAGLVIGFLLVIVDSIALVLWPPQVVAVIDVILLIIVTGALHLDGVSDTADGLFGIRDRETALSIMKDSRIGAMGAVALIAVLGLKFAAVAGLPTDDLFFRRLALFLIPAFARSGMLFGIHFLPYGRPGGGTGFDLFEKPLDLRDFWGVALCIGLTLFLGTGGLLIIISFFGITAGIIAYYRRRMGVITGDMLGALTELLEAGLFAMAALRIF